MHALFNYSTNRAESEYTCGTLTEATVKSFHITLASLQLYLLKANMCF